ncbi:hypothetical protein GLYMA_14G195100v4 [Glycine max]|uniref:Uncharacterized protein n=1 Tax=Glycine max TaxID=3847 RepID=K7M818_SOYBN|nr:hypothetical protein JHK85_041350 [Glycine max]KAG5122623.1 hypothetical protein JHK84_040963 [Glycine max]KAH1095332.1 hypothetical protein GYH30_040569 [Glycine max]KAH1214395.1 hypothetical protein GmHk_14G042134 [Glycine max]KRH17054.1 hypothetical protein GLYMA_14G195100v4 [Glycine max]
MVASCAASVIFSSSQPLHKIRVYDSPSNGIHNSLRYLVDADYFNSHSTRSLEAIEICVVLLYCLFDNPFVFGEH